MQTILGAGGVIGSVLLRELGARGETIRLASRSAKLEAGAKEAVAADLSDLEQTIDAVSGSSVVHLVVGLQYNLGMWQDLWPKIMRNTMEACKRTKAKLVFLDNVYMYGKVQGAMTEETPFSPCSKKGEIRARIATMLLDEIKAAGVPVIVHPTMYRAFGETENLSFETASKLHKAGIPVALQSGYESYVPKTRVVLFEAAVAAANGLTFDQALATITIDAARILGVDGRVGSLEPGKDGDLALYDGDPFEYTSHCTGVIINGQVVSESPQ